MSAVELIDVDAVVPDGIEPVEEWRTWNFVSDRLVSHNGVAWEPGEALKASCVGGDSGQVSWAIVRAGMSLEQAAETARIHNEWQSNRYSFSSNFAPTYPNFVTVPSVEPPDGYGYALERATHNTPDTNCTCGIYAGRKAADCPGGDVLGKVKLWGTIVPGEKGSRAEFAYPSELHVPARLANDPALLAYGVPIVVVEEKELVASTMARLGSTHVKPRSPWMYRVVIAMNLGACAINLGLIAARTWL